MAVICRGIPDFGFGFGKKSYNMNKNGRLYDFSSGERGNLV